jgi:hypothetical protein
MTSQVSCRNFRWEKPESLLLTGGHAAGSRIIQIITVTVFFEQFAGQSTEVMGTSNVFLRLKGDESRRHGNLAACLGKLYAVICTSIPSFLHLAPSCRNLSVKGQAARRLKPFAEGPIFS